MTRWLGSLIVLGVLAGPAIADGLKVQVLRSDGRADAKVRSKVDAAVLALARDAAKPSGDQVLAGDITFSDAAAAVGCKPEEETCKDEVLGMLSVDAIVVTTVTPKPGGFEIAVRRVGKGGPRDATGFVASDKVANDRIERLDGLAPVFGATVTARRPAEPPPPPPPPNPNPAPRPTAPPVRTAPPPNSVATAEPGPSPMQSPAEPRDDRRDLRLPIAGMAAGGAMILVGAIFWGSASGVQDDIDRAPANTRDQIIELQRLEDKAERYATAGNLMFVGGAILGGVSTYYFIKRRRQNQSTQMARVVPAVFPGGGGLSIVFGGAP